MKMTDALWREFGFIAVVDDNDNVRKVDQWTSLFYGSLLDINFDGSKDWTVREVVKEIYRSGYRTGARDFRKNIQAHLEWYRIDPEMGDGLPKFDEEDGEE